MIEVILVNPIHGVDRLILAFGVLYRRVLQMLLIRTTFLVFSKVMRAVQGFECSLVYCAKYPYHTCREEAPRAHATNLDFSEPIKFRSTADLQLS